MEHEKKYNSVNEVLLSLKKDDDVSDTSILAVLTEDALTQSTRVAKIEKNVKNIEGELNRISGEINGLKSVYQTAQEKRAASFEKVLWLFVGAIVPIIVAMLFSK